MRVRAHRHSCSSLALALLVGVVVVALPTTTAAASTCAVGPDLVNPCRPWLGANAGGYPGIPGSIQSQIEAHESRIGRPVDVAHTYHQPGQDSLSPVDLYFVNRPGTVLFTNWKPSVTWSRADGSDASVNATIDQMATSIKAVSPRRILLTIYHEPQNDVSGGAAGCPADQDYVGTSGTPDDYRAMWRNVRNRFDALGVDNVVWAIDYMSLDTWSCMVRDLWPGNDLVDWVLFDFYGTPTVTFDAGVSAFYNKLLAWSDAEHDFTSKPWGIGEWNIRNSYTQAQATAFYDDARDAVAQGRYPRLKLYTVFDNANGTNTRIGYDSAGRLDATKQAHYSSFAQDPVFTGGWADDHADPEVTLTAPAEGDVVSRAITVEGHAIDDTEVVGVRLLVDGDDLGGADVDQDGSVRALLDTRGLADGLHRLALRATDAAGRTSTTAETVVSVDNRDVQAPTVPGGVQAVVGADGVTISWDASTDDRGVTGYLVQRDGRVVGTVGQELTAWSDQAVEEATSYSYQVQAEDAAGNRSDPSDPVVATVPVGPDTDPPAVPDRLTAVTSGPRTVVLAWAASADDVAVAGYQVLRDGVVVADQVTDTSFVDDGLDDATAYGYQVRARDTSDNLSGASAVLTVTTPDGTPPAQVAGLGGAASGPRAVQLSWSPAGDNVGVTGYRVYRDGVLVASPSGTTFLDVGVLDATTYSYRVAAVDSAANVGAQSVAATVSTPDGTAPQTPGTPTVTATTGTSVSLRWNAVTDNVGVTGYRVYRNGSVVTTLGAVTTWTATGLTSAMTYQFAVDAIDAAGNPSGRSSAVTVTTRDTVAPARPTGVVASATAATQVTVSWAPTTDNVAVTGYRVYRGSTLVATLGPVTTFGDSGLAPRTSYSYSVEAVDAAGNVSSRSSSTTVTTRADTTAPSVPGGLASSTSGSRVVLSWAAATDDVRATGYGIYRNGSRIATTTSLTWTDTSGTQGTTYQYSVDAYDAAGNRSARSGALSVKVPDVTAPGKPGGPTLTPGTRSMTVRWTAASDNVGVTAYRVYRGSVLVTTVAGTVLSFVDTGLTSGTTYSYRVVALDAAGNVGTSSSTVSARAR